MDQTSHRHQNIYGIQHTKNNPTDIGNNIIQSHDLEVHLYYATNRKPIKLINTDPWNISALNILYLVHPHTYYNNNKY